MRATGGGSATTTHAENIGVMAATRVYSTAAYWVAAAEAIALLLCPKVGAAISAIPPGVLGGATVVLYGLEGHSRHRPRRVPVTGFLTAAHLGSRRRRRGVDRRARLRLATVAVGLDRGRQRHEYAVLADLVDQPCGLERVPQILLNPRHCEHDSAPF
ncbi:MAG: hypothetical protein QOJ20_5109 [Mycobacterium sp.]|jgi:hypothetical protein|nr:hypothetical protein [Mycobacterium sp.]MDT5283914.1 hypothetical protein [Mycobacterium sp.]